MKVTHKLWLRGFVVSVAALGTILLLGQTDRALAQPFTLNGTVEELVARGINADFEQPALEATDGETFNSDIGAGWTFNLISGNSNNQGVQNPATGFFGQANDLPPPFEGNQIGFFNLNDPFSLGEMLSDPIGRLRAGETYTLNVAVGARNSESFRDVAYRVGLRASDGTDLGDFATVTLDPGSSPTNIEDLTYTLNAGSVPAYVGDAVQIVIGGFNTAEMSGAFDPGFTQANFDNVRLAGTFDELVAQSALVTIDRQTGGITLSNTSDANLGLLGYSLTSDAGSFDQAQWNRIGGNFTNLTDPASATDLSEMDFDGGGMTLTTTTPLNLGNAWLRTPFEDVEGGLLLDDGSILPIDVEYAGTAVPLGDLNGDGLVNTVDWALFKAGQGTDFTGLSQAQGYALGDLNGDGIHNLSDFALFRAAFEAANGAGSFQAMLAAVPEPSTSGLMLLAAGAMLLFAARKRSTDFAARKRSTDFQPSAALRPEARVISGWRRAFAPCVATARAAVCLALVVASGTAVKADVFQDRVYLFGDDSAEGSTAAGMTVGSAPGNVAPGATLDSEGPSGSFQDLLVVGSPVYADVSSRPGAASGDLGVQLNGGGDYLHGFSLGFPPISRGTHRGGGIGTLNFDGVYQRGMQLWVLPDSAGTGSQHVVSDTTQHGIRITSGGNWALVHAGTEVNSGVPVAFDEWSHVMAAMPNNSVPHKAVLYVNGEAVALHQANYSTSPTVNSQAMVVGANSHVDGTMIGTSNHFHGVLDDLLMYVAGRAYDPATGEFIDWGTFNFLEDNGFAALNLSPVLGDFTNTGSINQDDVDAFVAGWRHEKRIGDVRVGDITTYLQGDLNFDGVTDLRDAKLFRDALLGSGAGLDLSAFTAVTGLAVPEPSAVLLGAMALSVPLWVRRRRRSCSALH